MKKRQSANLSFDPRREIGAPAPRKEKGDRKRCIAHPKALGSFTEKQDLLIKNLGVEERAGASFLAKKPLSSWKPMLHPKQLRNILEIK